MTEPLKTYDLGEITFVFLGIPIEAGFGEGNVITIEKQDPDFTWKRGALGEVVRSKTYSRVYLVKVILLPTAAANAVLSGINALDTTASNGAGVGPILIRNRQGLDIFAGTEAWLEGPPKTVTLAQTPADREWTIVVADGVQFVGGA